MRWIFRSFMGAVVAGLGWKLGADAYETIKKHIQERNDKKKDEAEDGAGATQTQAVDVNQPPSTPLVEQGVFKW